MSTQPQHPARPIGTGSRLSHKTACAYRDGEDYCSCGIDPRIPAPGEPPAAQSQCGSPEDYEQYLSALRAAFGDDMGDGAEETLTCAIERLKRLAEQAVAMRVHFGEPIWHLDGEGVSAFLKAQPTAPQPELRVTFGEWPAYLEELANALNGIVRQPQYHAQQLRRLAREMREGK